jgi:molecular chaperone GrpE
MPKRKNHGERHQHGRYEERHEGFAAAASATAAAGVDPPDGTAQTAVRDNGGAGGSTAALDPEALSAALAEMSGRLEEFERTAAETHERYLRTLADFDNFRKRQAAEIADLRRFANEGLVADLLPILDNFERALASTEKEQNCPAVVEGVRLIHRQLQDILRKHGLEEIPAEGQPFDPTVHEAIGHAEPEEGQPSHHVAQELRKGYKLNGRVLRASLVKVTS